MSRFFFFLAGLFFVLGLVFLLGERLGLRLFHLPGDIVIKKENFVFYFPITTSILLSAFLTLLMWMLNRK